MENKTNSPHKKKSTIIIIVVCIIGGLLLLPFIILFIMFFGMYEGTSSKNTNEVYQQVDAMQQYLEEKYGKDENFQFTGKCSASWESKGYCHFKSSATNDEIFAVFFRKTGTYQDWYLDVKFKKPTEDYFNSIFKDINNIDSRIQSMSKVEARPRYDQYGNGRTDVNSKTFEDFINNSAVDVTIRFNIDPNNSTMYIGTDPTNNKKLVDPLAEKEVEGKIFNILQEKQVAKNIKDITFTTQTDSVESWCMSYSHYYQDSTSCHRYDDR